MFGNDIRRICGPVSARKPFHGIFFFTAVASALLGGCVDSEPVAAVRSALAEPERPREPREAVVRPEVPAIMRDVHLIDDSDGGTPEHTQSMIPPFRTSADGRIGIDLDSRKLFLLAPEFLDEPVTDPEATPGPNIVVAEVAAPARASFFDASYYARPEVGSRAIAHQTICDATPQRGYGEETVLNPHPCDTGEGDSNSTDQDCYSLVMISVVEFDTALPNNDTVKRVQLWSKPFTAVVTRPKRPDATLSITVSSEGLLTHGPAFNADRAQDLSITADGRLIVFKLGKSKFDPEVDPATIDPVTRTKGPLDIIYSVYDHDDAGPPCDVTKWTKLKPMSKAYGDPSMSRYGIAAYPLRDPSDNPVPEGEDLLVSYPWIDRGGKNLFFTALSSTLFARQKGSGDADIRSRYPSRCVGGGDQCWGPDGPQTKDELEILEVNENFNGVGVVGLWTNGKMVLLDNAINNIDYGLGANHGMQRDLLLYSNRFGAGRWVRAGTGRYPGGLATEIPVHSTQNTSFIDSLEHLFNWNANLKPLAVRDVVWILNTGKASAELIFDDYLDPNAVIFAEMSGALARHPQFSDSDQAKNLGWLEYYDGFDQTGRGEIAFDTPYPVRFQNAATSLTWQLPPYGVAKGGVRIEPVALGGIEGKGAWLDGVDDSITFDIDQSQADPPNDYSDHAWYLGIFIDPRFGDLTGVAAVASPRKPVRRELFSFGSGDKILLVGDDAIEYVSASGDVRSVRIAAGQLKLKRGQWTHLAFVLDYPGDRTDLYVNGFLKHQTSGVLHLGNSLSIGTDSGALPGFKGWIDEVKLLAYRPTAELACNHARGTLMQVSNQSGKWLNLARAYPQFAHQLIQDRLAPVTERPLFQPFVRPETDRYVCYHDYLDHRRANPRFVPAALDLTPIRHKLNTPLGRLVFDAPRPDSRSNAFCLTCHRDGAAGGLSKTKSLGPHPSGLPMWLDPRRQPTNPPRMMFGNVPVNLFPFGPVPPPPPPNRELAIDQYVFPHLLP